MVILMLLLWMPELVLATTNTGCTHSLLERGDTKTSVYDVHPDSVSSTLLCGGESGLRKSKYARPWQLGLKYTGGKVLESNESVRDENAIPYAQYVEAKFGFAAVGNKWQDIAYGMPYYGIGVGYYDFNRSDLGHPLSVYLYQGARLSSLLPTLQLKYEWHLGTSFGWKVYDPVTNPRNECVSARANVYFGGELYLSWAMSRYFDLNVGATTHHVSNGATTLPNYGMNVIGAFVGLTYNFDRDRVSREYNPFLTPPAFRGRIISDISVHTTVRQRKLPVEDTGLSSEYIGHDFFVMGVSYALLNMPTYRHRYGISLDGVYDEGANHTAKKIGENPDGSDIAEIYYGKTADRFSLGVSLRGDVVMPRYTVSGQCGYDVLHKSRFDNRWYQSVTLKVPFWDNLYGSFAIRSKEFSKAQYLFFGMGYSIDHKKKGAKL